MTLPITTNQAKALFALRDRAPNIQFVVIGAAAVGHHVKLDRPTSDVDLAILTEPSDLEPLLSSIRWRRDPRTMQRWYGPDGFKADILPATAELIQAGSIRFDGDMREMSLIGFDLALEHAEAACVAGFTETIHVASLASLVVLKMVAWCERPYERHKDLGDLALMFDQGLPEDDDRRWDQEHPVGAAQLQYDQQSPFFVGLSVGKIARPVHRSHVRDFLAKLRDERHAFREVMAREAGFVGDEPEQRIAQAVLAFERGFERESH